MASDKEVSTALFNKEPTFNPPPTLEEFSMGGDYPGSVADYATEHLAAIDKGNPMGINVPDELFPQEEDSLFDTGYEGPSRSKNAAWNEILGNAFIKGNPEEVTQQNLEEAQAVVTVQDELVDTLIGAYQDDEFTRQRLQTLHELPKEEQIALLNYEIDRRDKHKVSAREALLMHVFRGGGADLTQHQFDNIKREFNVFEMEEFRDQLRTQQIGQLRRETDRIFARTDISKGEHPVLQIIQQDFIPFFNIATRGIMNNVAIEATGAKASFWQRVFPGEGRQVLREFIANATPAERIQYVEAIGAELEALKNGPYGAWFTEYGMMETFTGLFSEELLQNNISKDSLDRWMGNLDVVLEGIYGIGVIAKAGGRTFSSAVRASDGVQARRLARATGNHKLRQKLDRELNLKLVDADIDPAEAALSHLPRPKYLADEREIIPDDLKDILNRGERLRSEILVNSDDLTGVALTASDKTNVIRRELGELDSYDTAVVHPQMSVLEALPNDTGFKYTAVYGETPTGGWGRIEDALDEALAMDPTGQNFKVMRRNANGELEEVTDLEGYARGTRVDEGYGLNNLSDEELIQLSTQVEPGSDAFKALEKEAMRRASGEREFVGDALAKYDGEEFYLQAEHTRFWNTTDKDWLGPSAFQNTSRFNQRWWLWPSRIFGRDLFASFDKAYRIEQATIAKFNRLAQPFTRLGEADRAYVSKVIDSMEQFAKREGKAPSLAWIRSNFEDMTDAQLGGVLAINQVTNVQWEMFNRRLYREWSSQGFSTAKSVSGELPVYHGKLQTDFRGGQVYDPETQELVTLSRAEAEELRQNGGGVIKLDLAQDAPKASGKAYTLVKIDPDTYRVGALSTEVLEYRPGYFTRFYDDPYYIVKRSNKEVDGVATEIEDAIRTAGTAQEAERFLRRFATYQKDGTWARNKDPSQRFKVVRGLDLDNTEQSLHTKSALNREGRLFWDKRNFDRLPDVNGNRAALEDPIEAMNRSIVMATRQTTHEDLMKTMKLAFEREFGDLPEVQKLALDDIPTTLKRLQVARKNATEGQLKQRYANAIEFVKYMRMQLGTDEQFLPALREMMINLAGWLGNQTRKIPGIEAGSFNAQKRAEKRIASMDPNRSMRKVAFSVFMVWRPFRQLFLQAAQISFLAGLDPLYVATGRITKDGIMLRSGLKALQKSGYDDGLSFAKRAKAMGLSQKQYKTLIRELDRSGLLDTVDVHAFSGQSFMDKLPGDRSLTKVGSLYEKAAQKAKQVGFDLGEQLNLSQTYMLSLRRYMKRNGIDDLMKLEKSQWDDIAADAMQLALGMTKPNKMAYQSGILGTITQFMTFQHRAALTLLGQNPALSKADVMKMWGAGLVMFGPDMFGAGDYSRQYLAEKGLDRFADRQLEGWGDTLVNLLAYGLAQNALNALLNTFTKDYKEADLGSFVPGANVVDIWKYTLEGMTDAPWSTIGGPSTAVFGSWAEGIEMISFLNNDTEMEPGDKAIAVMESAMRNILPQYNDAMTAFTYYKARQWAERSGKAMPAEFEMNWANMLLRAGLGVRTREQMAYYQANEGIWQTEENMRSIIKGNRDHLIRLLNQHYNGEISKGFLQSQLRILVNLSEDWPEHLRAEIMQQSLITTNQDGVSPITIMAEKAKFITPDIAALLDQLPEMPGSEKEELRKFLEEVYSDRVDSGDELMKQLLQDDGRWLN